MRLCGRLVRPADWPYRLAQALAVTAAAMIATVTRATVTPAMVTQATVTHRAAGTGSGAESGH